MIASTLLTAMLVASNVEAAAALHDEARVDDAFATVDHAASLELRPHRRGSDGATEPEPDACTARAQPGSQPASTSAPAPTPAPGSPTEGTAEPRRRPDTAGLVLVGIGGVTGIVGLSVYGSARGKLRDPPLGGTEGEHIDRLRELSRRAKVGIAFASVGGAIMVAGVVRMILVARKREQAASSSAAPVQASVTGSGFVLRF